MNRSIAFIFDMDGTIIDNMKFHTQSWLTFASSLNIKLTEEMLQQYNHGTIAEIIRRICGSELSQTEVIELGERKEAMYRELYRPHLQLIPGFQLFIDEARKLEIPMAIATSAGKDNIDFTLHGLGIAAYFSAIVSGDDVKRGKPDPETFLQAAQKLNRSPNQCFVFEDTSAGIEAARNARMQAIALTTSFCDRAFHDWDNIEQIIPDYTTIHPAALLEKSYRA